LTLPSDLDSVSRYDADGLLATPRGQAEGKNYKIGKKPAVDVVGVLQHLATWLSRA
jgi:hypothetical protein